jgi:hypothetical protein
MISREIVCKKNKSVAFKLNFFHNDTASSTNIG